MVHRFSLSILKGRAEGNGEKSLNLKYIQQVLDYVCMCVLRDFTFEVMLGGWVRCQDEYRWGSFVFLLSDWGQKKRKNSLNDWQGTKILLFIYKSHLCKQKLTITVINLPSFLSSVDFIPLIHLLRSMIASPFVYKPCDIETKSFKTPSILYE